MKMLCKMHHFIARSDADSRVICVKMQCMVNGVAQQKDKNGVIEAIKWPHTNGEMEFSFLFGRREKC